MSNEKDGGPAFPSHEAAESDYRNRISGGGMSLRDYFAAKAMPSLVSMNHAELEEFTGYYSAESDTATLLAMAAYQAADAMLKERAQT